MPNIKYIELDLDQVEMWKPEVETPEYCENVFGSLGFLMYEYYKNFDLDVFDKHKSLIENLYVDTLINNKNIPIFFHKLDKLFLLKDYWLQNNCWRDPVVVSCIGLKNDRLMYYAHPGRDRLGIMRYFKIKSYKFLNINNDDINEDNAELIKSYWKDYRDTVVISRSIENLNRFVIGNKDGREIYSKFEYFQKWLRQ